MISWMKTERSWLLAITVVPLCQVEKLLHLLNGEFVAARFLGASQDALCQVKFVLLKIGQSQVVRMNSYGDVEQRVAIDLISYEIWSFFALYNYWLYLQFEDPGFNSGLAQESMDGDFSNLANTVDTIASLKEKQDFNWNFRQHFKVALFTFFTLPY